MWLPKEDLSAHDTIWCQDQQICSPGQGRHCLQWPMLEAPPLLSKPEASSLGILSKGNITCACSHWGGATLISDVPPSQETTGKCFFNTSPWLGG